MYAIVSAPCSGNAERENKRAGGEWRRSGKGNARRGLSCFAWLPLLSVHNISLCAGIACRGIDHRPPGGTFSVRFDDGKQPNRSCSSPKPLVLTF